MVQRSGVARGARRLLAGARMHGHSPRRLRHLGAHAAHARRHVQGNGTSQRVFPVVHSAELSEQGGRARRGICAGDGGGHAWRREAARGAARRSAHLRDDHLCNVREVGAELSRPAVAHQSVGERRPLGDADAALPAHARVPLAGGAHGARDARRGGGGGAEDARHLPRLHGRVHGDAGHHRAEDELGALRRRAAYVLVRGDDAGQQGAAGGDVAQSRTEFRQGVRAEVPDRGGRRGLRVEYELGRVDAPGGRTRDDARRR